MSTILVVSLAFLIAYMPPHGLFEWIAISAGASS